MNATLAKMTRYVSLLCGGMFTGIALTVLVVELGLRRLDGPTYVRYRQAEFGFLTWFIGTVLVPTLIAVVTLVVLARRANGAAFRPAVVALTLFMLALAITVVVNEPINVAELDWNPRVPPANWASIRDRWLLAHAVRTAACVIALSYLGLAVIGHPPLKKPRLTGRSTFTTRRDRDGPYTRPWRAR